ncbi:MAG: hypothetical protein ABI426_03795 [Flavobacterium sp.]
MLKNILNLEGVQKISRSEQKLINGKGDTDILACRCPNGAIVVGHADNCTTLINLLCELDS